MPPLAVDNGASVAGAGTAPVLKREDRGVVEPERRDRVGGGTACRTSGHVVYDNGQTT